MWSLLPMLDQKLETACNVKTSNVLIVLKVNNILLFSRIMATDAILRHVRCHLLNSPRTHISMCAVTYRIALVLTSPDCWSRCKSAPCWRRD
jgi:hypothetical protein